jgi:hypothetical protein
LSDDGYWRSPPSVTNEEKKDRMSISYAVHCAASPRW